MTNGSTENTNGPAQLPLAFEHASADDREALVVSSPLTAATEIIDRWPGWPSPVVVIVGPSGSGKSHLAAIWKKHSGAEAIRPVPESDAVSLATRGAILFEDAAPGNFDETELFHIINAVRENGNSLLVTSRFWPSGWGVRLPDLASRLKAATIVEIGQPDDLLLAQIIVKLFSDRQISIDDRLVSYIVSRMERTQEAARQIVGQLDHLALSRNCRITRALAAEVLDGMDNDA